jgi:hypothetical protein
MTERATMNAAAAAAAVSPTTSIQDVLNLALAAPELQKHFKRYIPRKKDSLLHNNLYKSYAVNKEYVMFLFLNAGDGEKHSWRKKEFLKAHADILNAIIATSPYEKEITVEVIGRSYKYLYFSGTKKDSKKELTAFLEERLTAQQLCDFRLAFQNENGFLKYHLFKACNTKNTDKFIHYFLQNTEFINAVKHKYKVKMSLNTAKDNVVCTLIIPTDCKFINRLFAFFSIIRIGIGIIIIIISTFYIHHLLVSCIV